MRVTLPFLLYLQGRRVPLGLATIRLGWSWVRRYPVSSGHRFWVARPRWAGRSSHPCRCWSKWRSRQSPHYGLSLGAFLILFVSEFICSMVMQLFLCNDNSESWQKACLFALVCSPAIPCSFLFYRNSIFKLMLDENSLYTAHQKHIKIYSITSTTPTILRESQSLIYQPFACHSHFYYPHSSYLWVSSLITTNSLSLNTSPPRQIYFIHHQHHLHPWICPTPIQTIPF